MADMRWNNLAYLIAEYRFINWYHAMADIAYYRETIGNDEIAFHFLMHING